MAYIARDCRSAPSRKQAKQSKARKGAALLAGSDGHGPTRKAPPAPKLADAYKLFGAEQCASVRRQTYTDAYDRGLTWATLVRECRTLDIARRAWLTNLLVGVELGAVKEPAPVAAINEWSEARRLLIEGTVEGWQLVVPDELLDLVDQRIAKMIAAL